MCMYVYMCAYVYRYAYIFMHACINTYMYMCIYIYVCVYTYIYYNEKNKPQALLVSIGIKAYVQNDVYYCIKNVILFFFPSSG